MVLRDKFTDTVVLKEDCNLEQQIEDLKNVREEVPDYYKDRVDYDIKMLEIGLKGEKDIIYELKHADVGMYVLHDITLKYEDLNAQFDFVIITKGFVYLVECKNLIGNIKVDSNGQFIREYEYKGDTYKEAIYSPYTQIVNKKNILKKRWINRHSKLRVIFQERYFDNLWYKPIVVLTNKKGILDIKNAPKEVRKNTIRIDELINYIKKDLEKYDSSYYESQKYMEQLANSFLSDNIDEYHNIADNYNEMVSIKKIESKLKHFRKDKSKKNNIPAYYIFTNEELKDIIRNKPKNIDELNNILPSVKVKCHGKQILKIINSKI